MRKLWLAVIFLLPFVVASCNNSDDTGVQQDTLPPEFSGIRSVSAIDNDLVFDYFMVRWYKAKDNLTPSEKITYRVYYKRDATELTPLLAGVVTGETLSYIVKIQRQTSNRELLPYYYFQVAAVDESGNVKLSSVVKAKAEDFHPPMWGYITEVQEISYDHLLIRWIEADDDRTYPSHIRYNIFATTNKSEIDYSKPISVVVGQTESIVNFDLSKYQDKTVYFTVVAEDLSGNRNINGIFRSIKVGKVEMKDLGEIRRPTNRRFDLDLSEIAAGMSYKIVEGPDGATLNGNILQYTPTTTSPVFFHVEGNNIDGDILVITFLLTPFEPPLMYKLTTDLKYVVPTTNEELYALTISDELGLYQLKERFDIDYLDPLTSESIDPSPVTWASVVGYFSYVTYGTDRFYLTIRDLSSGNSVTKNYPVSQFVPCDSTGYQVVFVPTQIAMARDYVVLSGSGVIEGFNLSGNRVFGFYMEDQNVRKVFTYCWNTGSEEIRSYPSTATIESELFDSPGDGLALHLVEPEDRVLLLSSDGSQTSYSLIDTTETLIYKLGVSENGQVYLVDANGDLYYLFGTDWITIDGNVTNLIYGGRDIWGVKEGQLLSLDGLSAPVNILPAECSNLPVSDLMGIVNQTERVWLILQDRVYSCSK